MKQLTHNRWIRLLAVSLAMAMLSLPASAQQIVITDLQDILFNQVPPTIGDIEASISFCVAMDQNGRYEITAWGDAPGDAFALTSGPYQIPYSVEVTDRRRPRGYKQLLPGATLSGLRVRPNGKGTCKRDNVNVRIRIASADLMQAAGGAYHSTLTLTVSPE